MLKTACFITFSVLFLLSVSMQAEAEIPHMINYQGKLTDQFGNPVPDSTYSMKFEIYETETGGAFLWEEQQDSVRVINGIFNVWLGEEVPIDLPFDAPYWLQVYVSGERIDPRRRMVSVGYCYTAENADKLDGLEASAFADTAHNHNDLYYTKDELSISDGTPPNEGVNRMNWNNLVGVPPGFADGIDDTAGATGDTVNYAWNADSLDGRDASEFVDLFSSQTITGTKIFNNSSNSLSGDGANLTNLNASNITTGELNINRYSAYNDLSVEGRIGSGSNQVAPGDHNHGGVYAPHLHDASNHTGIIGSYSQVSGTHDNSAHDPPMVDVPSDQTVTGTKHFENFSSTYKGSWVWLQNPPTSAIVAIEGISDGNGLYVMNTSNYYPTAYVKNDNSNGTNAIYAENSSSGGTVYPTIYAKNNAGSWAGWFVGDLGCTGAKPAVIKTSKGQEALYALEGPDVEFYCSGSGYLKNGIVTVEFERLFKEAISTDIDLQVVVSPTDECNGIYVASKTHNDFVAKELMGGNSNASFDWIAIARRKGYETRPSLAIPTAGEARATLGESR